MKILNKLYIACLLIGVGLLKTEAQENSALDAQIPRWFVGANILGGTQFGSITQDNWSNGYLNALNADISPLSQKGGFNFGFDANVGYFFGKKRNLGLGTGLQFIRMQSNLELSKLFVEYQSFDNSGSTFRQVLRSNNEIKEQIRQNVIGIPLMLMYKKQLNNKWGINVEGGLVFNLATAATYRAENANFTYEAIYKLDNNGNPAYDNSPVPDPNS